MSPWRHVQRRRVERARQLLANRHLSLSEVALRSGFADQRHFTNVFRKATGLTPRGFRMLT